MSKGHKYAPPPGMSTPPPPPTAHSKSDNLTVKGLFFMVIAGILILVGTFVCAILSFIGWILVIVGFFRIYRNRLSYPEPHPSNMKQSLISYIIGITLIIISYIVIMGSIFAIAFTGILEGGTISFDEFLNNQLTAIAITNIGFCIVIIGRFKLLFGLIPQNREIFLRIATIISIFIFLAGIIILPYYYVEYAGTIEDLEISEDLAEKEKTEKIQNKMIEFQQKIWPLTTISSLIIIITEILFILCFYFAYDHQKTNPQLRTQAKSQYPPPPKPNY